MFDEFTGARRGLALLPRDLLQQLWQATEMGQMETIETLIQELLSLHPAEAATLAELAGNFEYDALSRLLEPALQDSSAAI